MFSIQLLTLFTISCVIAQQPHQTVFLKRIAEPNERAFSLLLPQGWQCRGGVFRVNPVTQGGAAQSIAAKVDFAVGNDADGTVMLRWLPEMLYFDMRMSPAGQMGLFPPGSNYNGMTVFPLMTAREFLYQIVIPYAHPGVPDIVIVEVRSLPRLVAQYQQRVAQALPMMTFRYDAALMTVRYAEKGVVYKERLMALVEDWGSLGAGMWGNKETLLIRAPAADFEQWEPLLSVIQNSVDINPQWLSAEIRGQLERSRIYLEVMQNIQQIERDMLKHQQLTNAEIHNDMFLTLMDREEFVNPFTREVETGSNQWKHRWINPAGEVIYSNDDSYDPRVDVRLNRSDYQVSPIRPRLPDGG